MEKVKEIADRKGCTPGQLALAWVHSKGDDIFPIPGEEMSISTLFGAACMTLFSSCLGMAVTRMLHNASNRATLQGWPQPPTKRRLSQVS